MAFQLDVYEARKSGRILVSYKNQYDQMSYEEASARRHPQLQTSQIAGPQKILIKVWTKIIEMHYYTKRISFFACCVTRREAFTGFTVNIPRSNPRFKDRCAAEQPALQGSLCCRAARAARIALLQSRLHCIHLCTAAHSSQYAPFLPQRSQAL